jgi:UDP-N-acetylglucosamine 2-epimerase (non-hydrolysing)
MCALSLVASRPDVQIVYPVHRNPNVLGPAHRILSGFSNVVLLDPLPYTAFVDLMRRCWLIVTDSGGIQEEAPSLGKPVLVLREKTERPEALGSTAAIPVHRGATGSLVRAVELIRPSR